MGWGGRETVAFHVFTAPRRMPVAPHVPHACPPPREWLASDSLRGGPGLGWPLLPLLCVLGAGLLWRASLPGPSTELKGKGPAPGGM